MVRSSESKESVELEAVREVNSEERRVKRKKARRKR